MVCFALSKGSRTDSAESLSTRIVYSKRVAFLPRECVCVLCVCVCVPGLTASQGSLDDHANGGCIERYFFIWATPTVCFRLRRPSKTITAQAKRAKSSWITKLHSVKASEPMQARMSRAWRMNERDGSHWNPEQTVMRGSFHLQFAREAQTSRHGCRVESHLAAIAKSY